ncbi:MAG: FAD-dependent oxidoreductase [Smithellaceae bacterium]|nr:FAD-dependent oxidoreductase [Smithellaceae bacterium]
MTTEQSFPLLLSATKIGSVELRNRIVMPAMGMNMSDGGFVNQAVINHYAERAKGGVGLIICEVTCVDAPLGLNTKNMLVIDDDKYIPGFRKLTEAIHRHGAKCFLQISHTGRGAKRKNIGDQPVGPSAVPMPYSMVIGMEGEEPRELTNAEIKAIEDKYAAAALRAKEAGFDGVEVHATGYYLVAQFLSSQANRRTDEYGGTARKRATFALNVLRKIRQKVGRDFAVIYKLSLLELGRKGGINLLDGLMYAHLLEKAGADAIEVLAMSYRAVPTKRDVPDSGQGKGLTFPLSMIAKMARVPGKSERPIFALGRKAITVPLIAGGRTFEPQLAERALRKKRADLVFMGRGLLAEPHLPNMIASGTYELARPCIGCGRCIDNQLQHQMSAVCSGNAVIGKTDNDYDLPTAVKKKKVLVVGGGPAGMEAARIAASRGHDVTLIEKDPRLGGQLHYATVPPHKENLVPLITYFDRQLPAAGAKVQLQRTITAEEIIASRYDAVVCATGVAPAELPIPGIKKPHVHNAKEVLRGAKTGKRIVVIGGGLVGCETAEFLLRQKKKVAIIEMFPELAGKMVAAGRTVLLGHLKILGAEIHCSSTCLEIRDQLVLVAGERGRITKLPADTVVVSVGDRPDRSLHDALQGKIPELYIIGDAARPEGIAESVAAGYYTALNI